MLETPRASQELGVEYRKAFWEVFQSAPKARAMSADGVSYVLRTRSWSSCTTRARDDKGNQRHRHPPHRHHRRLANRVLMKHRSSDMCDLFTGRTADSRRLVVDNMITQPTVGILYPANTILATLERDDCARHIISVQNGV